MNTLDKATDSKLAERGNVEPSAKKRGPARPADRTKRRPAPGLVPSPPRSPVYWHGELPPLDAEPMGEHVVEATSVRVPHNQAHAGELWNRCYEDLMLQARNRLEQEITRLGGNYAHILDEHVESKYDGAKGEGWLLGRFRYVLYRQAIQPARAPKTLP